MAFTIRVARFGTRSCFHYVDFRRITAAARTPARPAATLIMLHMFDDCHRVGGPHVVEYGVSAVAKSCARCAALPHVIRERHGQPSSVHGPVSRRVGTSPRVRLKTCQQQSSARSRNESAPSASRADVSRPAVVVASGRSQQCDQHLHLQDAERHDKPLSVIGPVTVQRAR